MYFYLVYGLHIQSQIQLPWLQEGGEGSDITIIFGDTPDHLASPEVPNNWAEVKESEILLFDERAGRIWIRPELIVITAFPQANTDILVSLLLGSGLAAQLIWRNHFVLHASAIRLPNGNAIAFAGSKKAGKSTMAGFLYHHGLALVSDDVCPLFIITNPCSNTNTSRTDKGNLQPVCIQPGFPRIKLDPAILAAMGKNAADYSLLPLKFRIKHSYPASNGFNTAPVPLQAIFLLEEGDVTKMTKLANKDATIQLMRQHFRPFFLTSKSQQQEALSACMQITNNVPVFTLKRPKQISSVENVIEKLIINS